MSPNQISPLRYIDVPTFVYCMIYFQRHSVPSNANVYHIICPICGDFIQQSNMYNIYQYFRPFLFLTDTLNIVCPQIHAWPFPSSIIATFCRRNRTCCRITSYIICPILRDFIQQSNMYSIVKYTPYSMGLFLGYIYLTDTPNTICPQI